MTIRLGDEPVRVEDLCALLQKMSALHPNAIVHMQVKGHPVVVDIIRVDATSETTACPDGTLDSRVAIRLTGAHL